MQEAALFKNAQDLQVELTWLSQVLDKRFKLYFEENHEGNIYEIPVPDITKSVSVYSSFVQHHKMSVQERLILLLALTPHICPQLLDVFFVKNEKYGRGFSEFGGIKGKQHSGFLPTGETAMFLLAGVNLVQRFRVLQVFDPDHFFMKHNILRLETDKSGEPLLSGALTISREYLSYFTSGIDYKPTFSAEFPAKKLETTLDWNDLVLDDMIKEELDEIIAWIKYKDILLYDWGLAKKIKPGFRSLFYGPPGTGKTLTASLLGKVTGLDVYRIDLSKVVSKYIGETEKNLANIFDQAENKNWILFFDEADALFGKRTETKDSKDRYANQEVAYLLQRVEDFPGVVILATNLKGNIDLAFSRRFQSMIYFPIPSTAQRFQLWNKSFSAKTPLEPNVNLLKIAEQYDVTGGVIINVIRYCSLLTVMRKEQTIRLEDIIHGIRREFRKEGKTI